MGILQKVDCAGAKRASAVARVYPIACGAKIAPRARHWRHEPFRSRQLMGAKSSSGGSRGHLLLAALRAYKVFSFEPENDPQTSRRGDSATDDPPATLL
jgi:hypothetical protein